MINKVGLVKLCTEILNMFSNRIVMIKAGWLTTCIRFIYLTHLKQKKIKTQKSTKIECLNI